MIYDNRKNWISSINREVDFYHRSNLRERTDPEFSWALVDKKSLRNTAKQLLDVFGWHLTRSKEWLNDNEEMLWESRNLLNDELSKLFFDSTIVIRLAGHRKFYFPRIDFDDHLEIIDEKPFHNTDLPNDYLGLPLKQFNLRVRGNSNTAPINMVASKQSITSHNTYRQYFIRRNSYDFSPVPGDVVLDCGACIGDTSVIFAGLVAMQGEVHLFDPIPLHTRFCRLQTSLNPSLAHVFHINQLAVSNRTYVTNGTKSDSDQISPGGLAIDSFSSTSLDDYANSKLSRVDFIKMDIEGAEMDALEGASNIIQEFKPRLAISAYHKPNDFWEIPIKLMSLNPSYKLYFGHHSPVRWESVFYAVQH